MPQWPTNAALGCATAIPGPKTPHSPGQNFPPTMAQNFGIYELPDLDRYRDQCTPDQDGLVRNENKINGTKFGSRVPPLKGISPNLRGRGLSFVIPGGAAES